jgi:hypothetical protein
MALIKTETFTNENGVEMVREIYDTMVIEKPAHAPEPEPEVPQPTQVDRIEETVNSIASGTTAENTDAINALLGV